MRFAVSCVITTALMTTAVIASEPCQNLAPTQPTASEELGWEEPDCWGSCDTLDFSVAMMGLGCVIGVPLGISGVIRRRYKKLDASQRIYSFTEPAEDGR